MLKGLYDAAAGMKARLSMQDIIASNLSNAGTSGFQGQLASIQTQPLPSAAPASADPTAAGSGTSPAAVQSAREWLLPTSAPDVRQGVLQQTGVNTDVALDGPGYFMAQTARGPRLTRGGTLHADSRGELVTLAGDPLLGVNGRPIAVGTQPWQVATDGTVSADGATLGQLRVVRPGGPVQAEGAMLATTARVQDLPAGSTQVRQGFIEHSNVEPIKEMVDMIAGVRAYEASQKSVMAQDESLQSLFDVVKQL